MMNKPASIAIVGAGCSGTLDLITDTDGALINVNGIVSKKCYTLGPPQKEMLWESTAVPELRVRAMKLANILLAEYKN